MGLLSESGGPRGPLRLPLQPSSHPLPRQGSTYRVTGYLGYGPIVQCPQWGQEELWSLQAYLPSQTRPLPLIPRPRVPLRSLSEKLPPLLPHQWAVLQSDRLHGAVGDWRAEKKRNRPS